MRSSGRTPSNELLTDCAKKTEEIEVIRRGAVSPLKNIPREILCEFFLYANDSRSLLVIPPRRSTEFPWALVQVCSLWRDVLFGLSCVWENISIRDDVVDAKISAVTSIFQTILSRSAVQISLFAPHKKQLFTNLVIPNLTRLKGFQARVSQDSFRTFLELPRGSGDSLSSMSIHFSDGDLPELGSISLQTSPNLREVTLTYRRVTKWSHGLWFLPWARLTSIDLPASVIPIPTLHIILGKCMCLRRATLIIESDTFSEPPGEEVAVPKLEDLTLFRYSLSPNHEAFLRPLILPSLKFITVNDAQNWSQAAFTSLVTRSACPLESLDLVQYWDSTYDLHSLLKHIPSLRKLIIPFSHIPASVFEAMRRRRILPVLTHLECAVDSLGLSAALDLFESSVSGKSDAGVPDVGIIYGRLLCSRSHDGDEYDHVIKRYNSLRPKFRGNGRNIKVYTS